MVLIVLMKEFWLKFNLKDKVINIFLDYFVFFCFIFEGFINIFFNDRCIVINVFIIDYIFWKNKEICKINVEYCMSVNLWLWDKKSLLFLILLMLKFLYVLFWYVFFWKYLYVLYLNW